MYLLFYDILHSLLPLVLISLLLVLFHSFVFEHLFIFVSPHVLLALLRDNETQVFFLSY